MVLVLMLSEAEGWIMLFHPIVTVVFQWYVGYRSELDAF